VIVWNDKIDGDTNVSAKSITLAHTLFHFLVMIPEEK